MKCPLKFNKENDVVDGHIIVQDVCEEAQCAWWIIPYIKDNKWADGRCAIYELASKTYNVEAHVKVLDYKLELGV